MPNKFKVGDRVRVYATVFGAPLVTNGTVNLIGGDGMLSVIFDGPSSIGNKGTWAHPKQCRLLPKPTPPKQERRRVLYVDQENLNSIDKAKLGEMLYVRKCRGADDTEMVELRPGEVIVDREMLAKAWDESHPYKSNESTTFKCIAKALGLPEGK